MLQSDICCYKKDNTSDFFDCFSQVFVQYCFIRRSPIIILCPPPLFSDSKHHGSVAAELSHSGRTQGVCGENGSANAAAFTQQ